MTSLNPGNPRMRMATLDSADMAALASNRPRKLLLPRELSDDEFGLFRTAGKLRQVNPGELIFRRGELGRSMFLVENGQVQLEFGDGLPDKVIGPRQFFGELALFIGNHARVANATAATAALLHVVEAAEFESLLAQEPCLLAQFMRRSFAYLVASEQQLIQGLKRRNEDLLVTLDSLRQTRTQLDTAERMIQTDELTGICNRRGLYAFLSALDDKRMPDTRLGVLVVDLDRFKQINDGFGHLTGDIVLRAIARELQSAAAPCDLPCRLGGDEFALLVQVRDSNELSDRARQVVMAVRALRFAEPNVHLRTTVSVGATLCDEADQWSHWYSAADSALYDIKGQGGDDFHLSEQHA
jgi:diguanylate cyclase (GGDEF)-like protein